MLKSKDLIILDCLRKDSRISPLRISTDIDLSVDKVERSISRMEKKIIKKYVSFIDFHHLGYKTHANLYLYSTDPDELLSFLCKYDSVNSIFKIKGEYNFLIDAFFSDAHGLEAFKKELTEKGVKKMHAHEILDEIKHEGLVLFEDERIDYPKHLFMF